MARALCALLLLAACAAPRLHARQGPISPTVWPQGYEQCAEQPKLDWCRRGR